MYKIKIITVGKIKENWLLQALSEYEKRLQSKLKISKKILKDEKALLSAANREKKYICLDSRGSSYTSIEFSKKLFKLFEDFQSSLTIFIGPDVGLSDQILKNASHIISLSKMTFTHQMVRLILFEQIYRAFEIEKGSSYHK